MKFALMQPTFNPWLGYFDLIEYVDTFVFFDTVQLNQQSWQTRNKLMVQKREHMFSLPVMKNKMKNELSIQEALLDFRKFDFRKKLARTLEQNYAKAEHFDEVILFVKSLVMFETEFLSEYNINIVKQLTEKLGFTTQIKVLSSSSFESELSKGELVLEICKFFNASVYVSPLGAKEYLDKEIQAFMAKGIEVEYQYYKHPVYEQLSEEFIPYIGIFDLLFNEGFRASKEIILRGRDFKRVA
ncbi:MAG TPA: hypothetical protein ENK66_05470 [Arcobacter sp.]|nr:hypothetical protein [Arcobacter sp.]